MHAPLHLIYVLEEKIESSNWNYSFVYHESLYCNCSMWYFWTSPLTFQFVLIAIPKRLINESIFIYFGVRISVFVHPCRSTVRHLTTRPTHRNGLYLSGTLGPFIILPYFQVCQECRNCFFLKHRSYILSPNRTTYKADIPLWIPRFVSEMDVPEHKLLLTEIVCLWRHGFLSPGVNLFDLCCFVQHLY